jgi:hypothetical protein
VNLQVDGPAPLGDRPENQAATKQLDGASVPSFSPADDSPDTPTGVPSRAELPAYVVVLITRYGMPRRKVYLDLGHARAAVARARGKGLPAWLVLCELVPVQADLDLDLDHEVGS